MFGYKRRLEKVEKSGIYQKTQALEPWALKRAKSLAEIGFIASDKIEETAWDIQGKYQNEKAYIEAMEKTHLRFIEDAHETLR